MTAVSQADFARDIGKSRQYVSKLVRLGKLPVLADGKLDAEICKALMAQMADPARRLGNKPAAVAIDPMDDDPLDDGGEVSKQTYSQAALIHKLAQGKLLNMQLRKEAGELVEKAEVEREGFDCARIIRDRLMALPQEMAGELVSMTDEGAIRLYLRNKLRDALMEASKDVGDSG